MSKLIRRLLTSTVVSALMVALASGAAEAKLTTNHNETLASER